MGLCIQVCIGDRILVVMMYEQACGIASSCNISVVRLTHIHVGEIDFKNFLITL